MRNKGFTLIELSVGIGVIAILILTGLSVQRLLMSSTKNGERIQASLALSATVRERLKYSNLCGDAMGTASGLNRRINVAQLLAGREQVEVRIPSINAGPGGTDDVLRTGQVIPGSKITINDLRFVNVRNVSAGGNTFVGQLRLAVTTNEGLALRPFMTGTVQFDLSGPNGNQSLVSCGTINSDVSQQVCETMGCEWRTTPLGCFCRTVSSLCPLGEYPIEFLPTGPRCERLGGPCPAGQYLTSVGIGTQTCADLPITGAPPPPPPPPGPGPGPMVTGQQACMYLGSPCTDTQTLHEGPTFIVDLCACTTAGMKQSIYGIGGTPLGPGVPGGGDQFDYTIRCTGGVIQEYTLPCFRVGGGCECR